MRPAWHAVQLPAVGPPQPSRKKPGSQTGQATHVWFQTPDSFLYMCSAQGRQSPSQCGTLPRLGVGVGLGLG